MLIHGSWHNAWNWHKVVPLIEAAGHRVICIDLPGMGRDKTPVKEVTLQKSVAKITEVIDQQPDKLILVGHSKNGIMVSQAAEYRPDKMEALVNTGTTRLELTDENFGRIPRYYIECLEDRAVTPYIQQKMYMELPCQKVYQLKSSHSPFFSRPEELVTLLFDIASIKK